MLTKMRLILLCVIAGCATVLLCVAMLTVRRGRVFISMQPGPPGEVAVGCGAGWQVSELRHSAGRCSFNPNVARYALSMH